MAVKLVPRSRLRFGELVIVDGVEFWDLLELPEIPESDDDLTHQVQSHDRIDTIAMQFYGDPILWFVIAVANGLEIMPTELNVGEVLRIPSPTYVLQKLFTTAVT